MKRYDIIDTSYSGRGEMEMVEDPEGEYVKWEDIAECNCEEVPWRICPKYEYNKRQQKGEE